MVARAGARGVGRRFATSSVLLLLLVALPAALPTVPAEHEASRAWSTVADGPYVGYPGRPEGFVTSDGTIISYAVHRPVTPQGERVPIILTAGPYFGLAEEPVHVPSTSRLSGFLVDNFVSHGYAVVAASVRGTGQSGGCMELMSEREARDLDELVTFLATRPWADGNVGMIGKSYDGTTPWMVAQFGNPHLKTIVPIAGVTDLADLLVHRGVPQFRTPYFHALVYHPFGFGVDAFGGDVSTMREADTRATNAMCPEAAAGLVAGTWATVTGDTRAIPLAAAYWAQRAWRESAIYDYEGSVFIVHGLQDFNVVPHMVVPLFSALPHEKKLLLGQWGHQYPDEGVFTQRDDFAQSLKDWFDRHLKGMSVDTGPLVEVADAGTGTWRALADWPAPTQMRTLYLSDPDRLTPSAPVTFRTPVVTPAGASVYEAPCAYQNAPRFVSAPLVAVQRVSGVVTLDLTIEPATSGAVVAILCVDGRIAAHGATNLLYPQGGAAPQPFTPGRPLDLRVVFEPVEHTMPVGARLTLAILVEDAASDRSGGEYAPTPSAGVAIVTGGVLRLPLD